MLGLYFGAASVSLGKDIEDTRFYYRSTAITGVRAFAIDLMAKSNSLFAGPPKIQKCTITMYKGEQGGPKQSFINELISHGFDVTIINQTEREATSSKKEETNKIIKDIQANLRNNLDSYIGRAPEEIPQEELKGFAKKAVEYLRSNEETQDSGFLSPSDFEFTSSTSKEYDYVDSKNAK